MSDRPLRKSLSRRARLWWAIFGAALTVLTGGGLAALVTYFRQPLQIQAGIAGVVSMFVGLAGLTVSTTAMLRRRRALRGPYRGGGVIEPASAKRVRLPAIGEGSARALALGVHPARPHGGTEASTLPHFVTRDLESGIRDWMRLARADGGFLLIVGDSCVGKTRLLYETARTELAGFAVLAPDRGDGAAVNALAERRKCPSRLIVWLDELHRFVDGPYLPPGGTAVTAKTLRQLLDTDTPVVILGTLWPQHAAHLRATDPQPRTGTRRHRYPGAADVLDADRRRHEVTLRSFSARERAAAEALRDIDPRLATAVADPDYNVTEALAGAPELIRRYQQASEEQRAVLCAAVDAVRAGIRGPLTADLLRAAGRTYLTSAHPDASWFPPALDELTRDERSTAALITVLSADRRTVVSYTVCDYLLQYAGRERRTVRLREACWEALLRHASSPDELARLADGATNRLALRTAERIYRHLAATGCGEEDGRLAELYLAQDRAHDLEAATRGYRTAELAAGVAGTAARTSSVTTLVEHGQLDQTVDQLQTRTEAGDLVAAHQLAQLLRACERDEVREAIKRRHGRDDSTRLKLLRDRAGTGDEPALLEIFQAVNHGRGYSEEARTILTELAALDQLAEAYGEAWLRSKADRGSEVAAAKLTELLARQCTLEALRAEVDAGTMHAAARYLQCLAAGTATDQETAQRLARFGLTDEGSIADKWW